MTTASLARAAAVVGSIGLLGAMLIDSAAVLGRHAGTPLLGSIELAEVCVVLMASTSLIGTTLERGHASVHLLTERLPPRARDGLGRVNAALCAVFFAAIAAGSIWVARDLWHGDEHSELLGIPIAPLRVLWCASAAGVAVAFLLEAFAPRTKP